MKIFAPEFLFVFKWLYFQLASMVVVILLAVLWLPSLGWSGRLILPVIDWCVKNQKEED